MSDYNGIRHEDKCRIWEDEEFCDCGALESNRLELKIADLQHELNEAKEKLKTLKDLEETWKRGSDHHSKVKAQLAAVTKERDEALAKLRERPDTKYY